MDPAGSFTRRIWLSLIATGAATGLGSVATGIVCCLSWWFLMETSSSFLAKALFCDCCCNCCSNIIIETRLIGLEPSISPFLDVDISVKSLLLKDLSTSRGRQLSLVNRSPPLKTRKLVNWASAKLIVRQKMIDAVSSRRRRVLLFPVHL